MITCLAYVKKESRLLLYVQTVLKLKTRKPQRANTTLCSQALFGSHRFTTLTLRNKIEAVFINEAHCVAKWLVFYSFHLYIVRKLAVLLLFVRLLFFCLKFGFVVFSGFLADISHMDWSQHCAKVMRAKFIEIRSSFPQNAVILSGLKNRTVYFTYDASMTS